MVARAPAKGLSLSMWLVDSGWLFLYGEGTLAISIDVAMIDCQNSAVPLLKSQQISGNVRSDVCSL